MPRSPGGCVAKTYPTEFKNKKVVLVSTPGAFTPTCHVSHVPSYLKNIDQLKAKGVDQVIVIAANDAFVMSAWSKANNVKDDYLVRSSPVPYSVAQPAAVNFSRQILTPF